MNLSFNIDTSKAPSHVPCDVRQLADDLQKLLSVLVPVSSIKFMVCRSRDMNRARDLPDLSVFPLQTFRADRPVRQMGASDFYKNLFHPLLVPLMIR